LLVLVVGQIVIAVYAFMYTEELATAARKGFRVLWDSPDQKDLGAVHGIQRGIQCCGYEGPRDWASRPGGIPTSCCAADATTCSEVNAFQKGCGTLLFDMVSASGMLIAWIAIVFGAFEVRN
jgi:Tetraspanin family